MGKIEKIILTKLVQKAKAAKLEAGPGCLPDTQLNRYLCGALNANDRKTLEEHIAECFLCLDKLVCAYDGRKLLAKGKIKPPPKDLMWKARNIDRLSDIEVKNRIDFALDNKGLLPRTQKLLRAEKAVINWLPKNLRKNRWLIAAATAFVLSFAFPPVFLQFLIAAGILGGKWIFDSENARTLIMIYNAWKKGGEKEAQDMLEVLKDRIPTKK